MTDSTIKKKLIKLIVIAVWIALWQLAYVLVGEDLLLVSPLTVLYKICELASEAEFWLIILNSLLKIMLGFLLGVFVGTLIAVITARYSAMYQLFYLPMNIIKATPVTSFIILALVWISGKNLSVFISFLMVLPLVWSNVHDGIQKVDPKLIEMGKMFGLKKSSIVKNIFIPGVLPYFLAAVKVGLGFSWKAGISGEVIAIPAGAIGTQLYNAKIYLDTASLFAWTVVVIVLSIIIEKLLVRAVSALVGKMNRLRKERPYADRV